MGAIYRRQPARKGVAKDGEWFTLTVVAHGRHLATWVNGIQVADWTDNRKPADNARNGFRAEKGPVSIQGHDPTTDLSFRNIRYGGDLPPAAGPQGRGEGRRVVHADGRGARPAPGDVGERDSGGRLDGQPQAGRQRPQWLPRREGAGQHSGA